MGILGVCEIVQVVLLGEQLLELEVVDRGSDWVNICWRTRRNAVIVR